jgi:membrane protein YdbS with pleckstrin-like domain
VWQAIAQSGVNLSSLPQEEIDRLVDTIAESVLLEMDEILGEASEQSPSTPATTRGMGEGEGQETLLWEGRPFLSISVRYQITTERLRVVEGIMGKAREDIELVRVQDVDQTQSFGERMVNVGDIHIRSHDPSSPEIVLHNVTNPQEVHEILRRAVLEARKKHKLYYREEM